jgi:hypothetical protein
VEPVEKKTRNVVYLIASPLQARDYDRFGIDMWRDRGWNVFVFDFTKILKEDFWNYVHGDHISVEFSGLKIFSTNEEAIGWFDRIKSNNIFIDFLGSSPFEQRCRKIVKQNGKILRCNLGSIPFKRQLVIRKICRTLLNPNLAVSFLVKLLSTKNIEPDYVVVSGVKSEQSIKNRHSNIIRAHNFDYDFFLQDKKNKYGAGSYILFLDEDCCYHSDYIRNSIKPCASPTKYFPTMNKGLMLIGNAFNSKVIVAAHPRSDVKIISTSFEHPVKKNSTFDLIKNAKLVVAHGSTSIQWAVLLRKPILLVTTNELEDSYCSVTYSAFRSELQKSIINLDRFCGSVDLLKESAVDDLIYNSYIENYIKQNKTPLKQVWEIVIDKLEADLNNG